MSDDYVMICTEKDLDEGAILVKNTGDRSILLAKQSGIIYALDDICTHDGAGLGDGDLIDGQIQCPRHGARFDLKTGAVTRMPAIIGISAYKVKVDQGKVYVALPTEEPRL